jgi:hypothetical protein
MAGDFAQPGGVKEVISRRSEIGQTAVADAPNSDNSMLE